MTTSQEVPQVEEPEETTADKVVLRLADVLAGWLYRSIEVHGADRMPDGPVLGLVNHGGGFADPVVLVSGLDRMPRFIARDVIWKVPIARRVMDAVQAIPIHRRADAPTGSVDNTDAFASVTQALAGSQFVVIFPEGESIDAPRVEHLRTGAARMMLQAYSAGVEPLGVIPLGLHYQNKSMLRSDVYVEIGEPLEADDLVAQVHDIEDPREQVRALTGRFTEALRSVSPGFRDWAEANELQGAAGVALNTADEHGVFEVPVRTYGNETKLARVIAQAPPDAVASVRQAYREYADDLSVFGLTDADVAGQHSLRGRILSRSVQTAVAAPFALAALPANAPGMVVTALVGRLPVAPPTMATLKPMAAMLAFPAGWAAWSWQGEGARRKLGRMLLAQTGLVASLVVADRAGALSRAAKAFATSRRQPTDHVVQARREVVAAVEEAVRQTVEGAPAESPAS